MTKDVRAKTAQGPAHRLALRVYYEDTDFSGRVYHAAYLRFLERGRTEWLRARGFAQREMARDASIVFVVRRLTIDFIRPASMDDVLTIETRLTSLGAASFDFAQAILREETILAEALVGVVALKGGRPARLPPELRARLFDHKADA
ncbi:MAG TPA: tol-pal system-associated acyl-CoA thioesterase [Roseiarcus sp.]|nr:tol-pal system-associated acyl-CoA thioesterase [Roseiarcus sp.]